MPRALAEIGRAAPDLTLYPLPVTPRGLREAGAAPRLRLMAEEYVKFLAASLDLTALLPRRAPTDQPHDDKSHDEKSHDDGAHEDSARAAGARAG
jgi:hypothetical protein